MRTNQNKRMRGRSNSGRKSQNPLTRVYESNGPDVKIRGSASHVAEKYVQLARDAQTSGDPVAAENYYQHAEHYFRMIAAAQEQYRQNQPFYRPDGEGRGEESYDGDDDGAPTMGGEPGYGSHDPQPYLPREAQPFPQRESHQPRDQQPYPQRDARPQYNRPQQQQQQQQQQQGGHGPTPNTNGDASADVDRLPSFITGGGSDAGPPAGQPAQQGNGQNGHEGGYQQSERYSSHRRRRRHRNPRDNNAPSAQGSDDARQPND